MSTARSNAPVIIKRKKIVGGDGHHGGAWKVAYADFVTAMMAFFLLMWLLSATSDEQRLGLAEYFNPTISLSNSASGGDGMFGGDSVYSQNEINRMGTGAENRAPSAEDRAKGQSGIDASRAGEGEGDPDAALLESLAQRLTGRAGDSEILEELGKHIAARLTDKGLVVELFDLPDAVLFEGETAEATPLLRRLVRKVAGVFDMADNDIVLDGHVRAEPIVRRDNPVWDLSTARAQTVRGLLFDARIDRTRIKRVSGFADRNPVVDNPMAVRNNRIELLLVR